MKSTIHNQGIPGRYGFGEINYMIVGRVVEAVWHYEETLITRERVLGSDHPDTVHSRDVLDPAHRSLGSN